ncbi:hypothetical protein EKO27_g4215 [Xylaria grammica]|uniref:Cyanovirin-N domain-containing protein n=1 Tax=Xylaria grammica TaxID=363999 RepID=A0A439D927_9PEZI|nr:hypothetical protein EKO27_g4215 [Xylaria grammica]
MNLFIFIALQAVFRSVSAAPIPDECLSNERTKLRSCNGFSVDGGLPSLAFLHAECHGFDQKAGKWDKVETGLDLNKCMVNVDGHLTPRKDGHFAGGCEKEMNVVQDDKAGTVTFTATCNGNVKNSIELGT